MVPVLSDGRNVGHDPKTAGTDIYCLPWAPGALLQLQSGPRGQPPGPQ